MLSVRKPLWCLSDMGAAERETELGVALCLPAFCTADPDSSVTPRHPSSVAIESATIRISSLHLFQIISFTLNCLCKLYMVSYAQARKQFPGRPEALPTRVRWYLFTRGRPHHNSWPDSILKPQRPHPGRGGEAGADTPAGFRPWFTGGPGAVGPPSEVQCKRDTTYTQRVWVLFSLALFFFAVAGSVCMEP